VRLNNKTLLISATVLCAAVTLSACGRSGTPQLPTAAKQQTTETPSDVVREKESREEKPHKDFFLDFLL